MRNICVLSGNTMLELRGELGVTKEYGGNTYAASSYHPIEELRPTLTQVFCMYKPKITFVYTQLKFFSLMKFYVVSHRPQPFPPLFHNGPSFIYYLLHFHIVKKIM